jgi:membrane protease YdiL (CAAX protease family)
MSALLAARAWGQDHRWGRILGDVIWGVGWLFGFAIASFEKETIFKGFLQEVIGRKHGGWAGNLLQAAIFSASHLGMEPLESIGNVAFLLLFRFGFGVLMGWLRMRRGTLLAAGIVHGFIG